MYVLQLLSLSHPLSYKIMQENKIKRRMSENIWVRQNLNSRPFVLGEYISPKQKKKILVKSVFTNFEFIFSSYKIVKFAQRLDPRIV